MLTYLKKWNQWRKGCLNGPLHKGLVLFGLRYSPTFHLLRLSDYVIKGTEEGLKHYE